MPNHPLPQIYYTDKAITDLIGIKGYLLKFFTSKEVNKLYAVVQSFEKVVVVFPELYPASIKNKNIHRAVLSKQLSVFYRVTKERISIIAIIDNRMSYSKWP
jgi:plasmid stabilization system protein ParE